MENSKVIAMRTNTCACSLSARPRNRWRTQARAGRRPSTPVTMERNMGVAFADAVQARQVVHQGAHAGRIQQHTALRADVFERALDAPGLLVRARRQQGYPDGLAGEAIPIQA